MGFGATSHGHYFTITGTCSCAVCMSESWSSCMGIECFNSTMEQFYTSQFLVRSFEVWPFIHSNFYSAGADSNGASFGSAIDYASHLIRRCYICDNAWTENGYCTRCSVFRRVFVKDVLAGPPYQHRQRVTRISNITTSHKHGQQLFDVAGTRPQDLFVVYIRVLLFHLRYQANLP